MVARIAGVRCAGRPGALAAPRCPWSGESPFGVECRATPGRAAAPVVRARSKADMCDQDHLEQARDFEARGWVTRRQFGVVVGAGIALMLPKVANAAAVTESDVTIKT